MGKANKLIFLKKVLRPPWRTIIPGALLLVLVPVSYLVWSPGDEVIDGRHDKNANGIWLQHGWLGDDEWFQRTKRDKNAFRNDVEIVCLSELLRKNHILYIFPHLCPCHSDGTIANLDQEQTRRFLRMMKDFKVVPWIGGVNGETVRLNSAEWRSQFVSSSVELLKKYPELAGVHINIEPLPCGNTDYILLLQEMKKSLPKGKVLSIAAYPPPTWLHDFPEVHWDEVYYNEINKYADQIVPMMYDTAIQWEKVYQHVISKWTREVLMWSEGKEVLLGVAAYDDQVDYHNPQVENIRNSLLGIHAGLMTFDSLPSNYSGVAIYSEWEMNELKWDTYEKVFLSSQN
jgi:hypothetical protein